jgi:hypothetical protein
MTPVRRIGIMLCLWGASAIGPRLEPVAAEDIQVRATVSPGSARIGERVRYRGVVVLPAGTSTARWLKPESHPDLTWGALEPRRVRGRGPGGPPADTLFVEADLQAFQTGTVLVPGLRFEVAGTGAAVEQRLPGVALLITPVLSAADSHADLRPVRGPVRAPWWEQVPWRWVLIGAAILAAVVGLVLWLRRRRPVTTPGPMVADPGAAALAELAALRGLRLPAHGRYADHAFHLTRILRRFLEAVVRTPRPGHTSDEFVAALERTRLSDDHRRILAALLRVWDRVKFARAGSSVEESVRAEETVEQMIRQVTTPVPTPEAPAGGGQ